MDKSIKTQEDECLATGVVTGLLWRAGCKPIIKHSDQFISGVIVELPGLKSIYRIVVEKVTESGEETGD